VKVSVDWLSDFVELRDLEPAVVADRLTVHTAEVDGVETIERDLHGLVVARIVAAEAFPTDLGVQHAVQVVAGDRRWVTVCGAPNVQVGLAAVFATPGARLADGQVVRPGSIHGRPSDGMLCSAAEIGLGTARDRLLALPADAVPGTPLADLVPARDTLIEIDNKSLTHRPDLWGHYGFARELAAIFHRPLAPFPGAPLPQGLPAFPVDVLDPVGCPAYSALALEVRGDGPSPLAVQARLAALGSSPISALVDVTNYAQLELGQPTHAFDARFMHHVRVARAGAPRPFTTLDGRTWELAAEDLLIQDGDEPVALAGIMGGLTSRVQADTTRIVLESANFHGPRIRMTSARLGLRTDASLRFEKKLPPAFVRLASARILDLLARWGLSPRPVTGFSLAGDPADRPRRISIQPGWIARRAGAAIGDDRAAELLATIGLTSARRPDGGLDVEVPPFRGAHDLSIPEDIGEEVMRLYGFDNITPAPPVGPLAGAAPHATTRNHHRMRRLLALAHRFVEVQTYAWFSDEWNDALDYRPPAPLLTLRNPAAADRAHLRDTLVPNLLAAAHQNRRIRDAFRIFELGRVFFTEGAGRREGDDLAGVVVDAEASPASLFGAARAAVEDLAAVAGGGALEFVPIAAAEPWFAAGRALEVRLGGRTCGAVGLLPAALARAVLDGGELAVFSLRTEPLCGDLFPGTRYAAPPQFPGSWQDFTFTFPVARGFRELSALLDGFSHPCLTTRVFVTLYAPQRAAIGRYTFRFELGLPDRTLTPGDIEDFRARFLGFVGSAGIEIG
jgi:phenylalanyl-tRNA synthetase beta chain